MSKNKETDKPGADDDVENDEDRVFEDKVSRVVNAAISAHVTRMKGSLSKDFEGMLKPFADTLAKLQSQQIVTPPPEAGKGNPDAALDIERQKMADKIRELEDRYKQAEASRESEQKARQRDEERNELAGALRRAGVGDAQIRPAIALLYTEEQRVARLPDTNKVALKVNGKYGEELVPVDEGVLSWLKTDDGKMFLPARGAGGSGTTHSSQNRAKPGTPAEKKAAAKAEAMAILTSALGGRLPQD